MSPESNVPDVGGEFPRTLAAVADNVVSWIDHVSAFIQTEQHVEMSLWIQAAICNSVVTKYGEQSIKEFARDVEKSPRRVWELRQTFRAYPAGPVAPALSFRHHTKTLRAAPEARREILEYAEDNNLSSSRTEEYIEYLEQGEQPENPTVVERVCEHCGGLGKIIEFEEREE